jgi:hypothetical protein
MLTSLHEQGAWVFANELAAPQVPRFASGCTWAAAGATGARIPDRTWRHLINVRFMGSFGGSGQYVYQLGREGWRLLARGGAYRPLRVVDLHTLTIMLCRALRSRAAW